MTVSEITQKAQHPVESNAVQWIGNATYRVESSADESYIIEWISTPMQCQCMEFFEKNDCPHIHAVKMTHQITRDAMINQIKTYSKKEILKRAKIVISNLNQRGWGSQEEHDTWSSQIVPWREELVILGDMAE